MVLYSRRVAKARAEQGGLGSGTAAHAAGRFVLGHRRGADRAGRDLRLAAVPERPRILVLRPGARDAREHRRRSPRATYRPRGRARLATRRVTMSGDLAGYLRAVPIDDPRFAEALRPPGAQPQPVRSDHHQRRRRTADPHAGAGQSLRPAARARSSRRGKIAELAGKRERVDQFARPDRRADPARLSARTPTSTRPACSTRSSSEQIDRANEVLERLSRAARRGRAPTSCGSMPPCCSARWSSSAWRSSPR